MENKKDYKLTTLGYAIPKVDVEAMVRALDGIPVFTKTENKDDGHVISFKDSEGHELFFAMVNSNKKVYLVRAVKDLFV